MLEKTKEAIWSNVDFPYSCLKDTERTLCFKRAINKVVKTGDIVLDAGSGSGILAMMAASAGAKKVYAMEIDRTLAQSIRKSVCANNLEKIIEVVEGDVLDTKLMERVDVVVAELMDTGLIDELQVPALNLLRKRGNIDKKTQIIPSHFRTYVQPAYSDHLYYGYKLLLPKHEWPFYNERNSSWYKSKIILHANKQIISDIDFNSFVRPEVKEDISFSFKSPVDVNAVVISSDAELAPKMILGATNALNSDKIIPIDDLRKVTTFNLNINYEMGGGFKTLNLEYS